jgi:2'-5' RNA ligase
MRLFVAVFPPPEVVRAALDLAYSLPDGPAASRLRWTPPENVHLTLKFLGDTETDTLPELSTALAGACGRLAPFDAQPSGLLGAFPSERRASVVWAGIGKGAGELTALAAAVEAALEPLGFPAESRAYRPHLTLVRVKGRPLRLELPTVGEAASLPSFRVESVRLMESRLGPGGASYREVESFPLVG